MGLSVGVILNPRSRYLRRHPAAIGRLHTLLGDRGLVAESKDEDHVRRVAEDFRAQKIDVVAIAGGDGTAGITIKAFAEVYGETLPPFSLLRGGTMNTVSNALHLPRGTPESRLSALLAATANGRLPPARQRSTLSANGRVGFLFGTGVFQSFLNEYYARGKGDPSAITAAETTMHVAASALVAGPFVKRLAAPVTLALDIDGTSIAAAEYIAVNAGTVSQVGLGFEPFYLADRFHGAFHLLALTGKPASIALDLPRIWLGLPLRAHNGFDRVSRRAVLTSPTGTIDFMVDGDIYQCHGPLVVESGPAVRIVSL